MDVSTFVVIPGSFSFACDPAFKLAGEDKQVMTAKHEKSTLFFVAKVSRGPNMQGSYFPCDFSNECAIQMVVPCHDFTISDIRRSSGLSTSMCEIMIVVSVAKACSSGSDTLGWTGSP